MTGICALTRPVSAREDQGVKGRYTPQEIEGMRHITIGEDNEDKGDNRSKSSGAQKPAKASKKAPDKQETGDDTKKKDKSVRGGDRDTSGQNNTEQVKPESHFRPEDDWQRLRVIPALVSDQEDKLNRALADVAAEAHKVTPYGLLLAARGHLQHGQMRQAGLYYYAARLRTRFDALRFPANNPSALKHDKLFTRLARQLSQPVYEWVLAKPERFEAMIARLRKWEMDTAYAYKPLYPVPKMRSREKWPKLHKKALKQSFAMLEKRAQAYQQQQP
jgi:hypothetical protein